MQNSALSFRWAPVAFSPQGRASKLQSAVAGSSGHDVSFFEKASEFSTGTVFLGDDCRWPRIKRCLADFCVLTYNEDVRSCFRCVRQFEYVWMLIWTQWQQHCQVLVSRRMRRSTHSPGLMEPCRIEHLAVDFQKTRKQETNFPANFH